MPVFKEFDVPNRWWNWLWGGGHTAATDPSANGWRAALSHKGGAVLLIGRRNTRGCASVMRLPGDLLDVCVYDDATPEEIADCIREGRKTPFADCVFQTESYPGWGLSVLERI